MFNDLAGGLLELADGSYTQELEHNLVLIGHWIFWWFIKDTVNNGFFRTSGFWTKGLWTVCWKLDFNLSGY